MTEINIRVTTTPPATVEVIADPSASVQEAIAAAEAAAISAGEASSEATAAAGSATSAAASSVSASDSATVAGNAATAAGASATAADASADAAAASAAAAAAELDQALKIDQNLADLADAATARTNLGTNASNVPFTPLGTGAVARFVKSRLDETVSVKDFGATGDGVTDDTAAINAAVNYVESLGGGTVFFPAGEYVTTASIAVGEKDVRLVGAGREATILLPATNTTCILFDFGGTAKGGWGVEDMAIKYSADGTSGSAIRALAALSGKISGVYIERCYDGIELGNSQATHVEHVDIWYNVRYGIFLNDNLNDVYLTEIFINGAQFGTSTPGTTSVGIRADGKSHAVMANNIEIVQSSSPMQLVGTSAADVLKPAFSTFVNCFFDSSTAEVSLQYCRTLKFIGCWFSNRATGVVISDSIDTRFVGCSFVNNDNSGCIVQATATHTSFTDCTFDSNGQSSVGTFNGLTIAANASDWQVNGGFFGNLGVFTAAQGNGIAILSGTSDRYSIRNATFSGNTGSAVANSGSGTNRYVEGNIGYRTANRGEATITTGNTTVTVNHGLAVTPERQDFQLTRGGGNAGSTDLFVSGFTSTQFTINTAAAPSANMPVSWQVRSQGA